MDPTFVAALLHTHDLYGGLAFAQDPFIERLESIEVQVKSISGAATLTMRMTRDAAGDDIVIPDVAGTIATGITTVTVGAVVYTVGIPIAARTASTFYLHFKVDAGTVEIDESTITWVES